MRQILKLIFAASLTFTAGNALATDYIYRELMANTLPSAKCEAESVAIASASKNYNIKRFSKKFCQTQGYGWHLEQIKDSGKPVCTPCDNPKETGFRCHMEDVVVECKRIKPGSVGMLPGKS
ncbi:MAG: hypothetical protein KGZ88_14305 [Methylomicrobium sp.]|nr:hypothetical protein [Methylomicrobium sp.]